MNYEQLEKKFNNKIVINAVRRQQTYKSIIILYSAQLINQINNIIFEKPLYRRYTSYILIDI